MVNCENCPQLTKKAYKGVKEDYCKMLYVWINNPSEEKPFCTYLHDLSPK